MSCPACLIGPALVVFCAAVAASAADQPAVIVNSLGMKLIRIEPGEFVMGAAPSPPGSRDEWLQRDHDESPTHTVRITRALYMGACEVTNAQYERFDPDHRAWRGRHGVSKTDDEPVTFVTWQQAVNFCAWLSKQEGRPYRLPTEAEWEYACRAGTATAFSTGDTLSHEQANIGLAADGKTRITTVPVGSYKPNPWGLFDMHGNVEEWCSDWYGPYEPAPQVDPVGRAEGIARVARGGSYNGPRLGPFTGAARYCRSANRAGYLPDDANRCVGFRVVLADAPAGRPLPPAPAPLNQQNVARQPPPATAPAAQAPRFISFTAARKTPVIPRDAWGPIFSAWNHYTALCVCPNGDVLAAWYTTVSEEGREVAIAASRLRAGADAWDPASLFFDVPDMNDHAPVLLSDGRRIYHFSSMGLRGWDDASNIVRISEDSGATWSAPRIILHRHDPQHLSQACSATIAADGMLVLAVDGDNHRDERIMTSRDAGRTWRVGAGCMRKACGAYAIHPAIIQRGDGALLAFMRGPNPMPVCISTDMGESWQAAPTPFPGISVGQKAAVLRLRSGAMLLCSIDNAKKLVAGGGTFAALSDDDGRSWKHIRKLEGVGGYMSAAQAPDGLIYIFGSRMTCVAFDEAWLRQ